jgi:epoxide hydrolase-like predicted phosphatase
MSIRAVVFDIGGVLEITPRTGWDEYLGTLNVELATYFASLRPRYRTAIISNSFVGAREKEQAYYGFGDICDLIVYSHEVGIKKPNPRIFELACERLDIQPSEMIFLDDFEEAVNAARQLGIHGIIFRDNAQAIADIEALLVLDRETAQPDKEN